MSKYYNNIETVETVENCLISIPGIALSVKSIAKRTGLRTKQVTYICYHSKNVRKVDPIEVGSKKNKMNTFIAI
jgi:hypothetical protein